MEQLRLKRTPLRTNFTKAANDLELKLIATPVDTDVLAVLLAQLELKGQRLMVCEEEIQHLLLTEGSSTEDFTKEFEAAESYQDRLTILSTKAKRLLSRLEDDQRGHSDAGNKTTVRKYRLPEIEFKRFNGDLKDWLGFWGQFVKIHEDADLDASDKFQYLLQATVPNSRPRQLVESFPPTADSYMKAIDSLKSRFGREDTLVEVYVRELLRQVLRNAVNPKQGVVLSVLYDTLETQLRALETLGVTTDKYAAMLYPLVESSLPEDILRAWERSRGVTGASSNDALGGDPGVQNRLTALMQFLQNEVNSEERIGWACAGFGLEQQSKKKPATNATSRTEPQRTATAAGLFNAAGKENQEKSVQGQNCVFCARGHSDSECNQASGMTLSERRQVVKQKRRCYFCLKGGHLAFRCRSTIKCLLCNKRHVTVMCPNLQTVRHVSSDVAASKREGAAQGDTDHALTNQARVSDVLLQTLAVKLRGKGPPFVVRALIDTGSQKSYITEKAARRAGYKSLGQISLAHSLFGGMETSRQLHNKYCAYLASMNSGFLCHFEVLEQKQICNEIPRIRHQTLLQELDQKGIVYQDDRSSGPDKDEIDLLIGADVAGKILTGRICPLSCGPVAVETRLGWTLLGKLTQPVSGESTEDNLALSVTTLFVREAQLSDLWNLDLMGITDPLETKTKEDLQQAAMEHFLQTVQVEDSGRYVVSLPWIEGRHRLPSNKTLAERRLTTVQKKLENTGRLEDYNQVLAEWKVLGIIEEVPPDQVEQPCHYLPHRPVFKDGSGTTKVRPVFDASSKQRGRLSLNDCLETGPNLVELVPSILTRFRMRRFGVTADIEKAFLQIGIQEQDRDFLRFLWGEAGNVKTYRHCRVVFGVSSSPFLLNATLLHHLQRAPEHLKETTEMLSQSFYIDNCVTSFDSLENVSKFIVESQSWLSAAHFNLRGWTPSVSGGQLYEQSDGDSVPVLGLSWTLLTDSLSCDLHGIHLTSGGPLTRRTILSIAHQVFDPIGFTCPVVLRAKVMLQETCRQQLSWDDELPAPLVQDFDRWCGQLRILESIHIPRWLGLSGDLDNLAGLEMHVFCDASSLAYATCIFLRIEGKEGVSTQLVQARSRVAPMKQVTIPRLELLACCIGVRLASVVKADMRLPYLPTVYWTDSTTALCWIQREEAWGTFVWNRVQEIRTLSNPEQWRHIPGQLNPADLHSRGCSARTLLESCWWEVPSWLKMNKKYAYRQKLREDLRARFRVKYLSLLRARTGGGRRRDKTLEFKVGDIVLLERLAWPLARVIAVYKGKDGQARVVRVKIKAGELLRSIQGLFLLEMHEETAPKCDESSSPSEEQTLTARQPFSLWTTRHAVAVW